MNENLTNIILDRLEAGETPAMISATYPYHSAEIEDLARTISALQTIPKIVPPRAIKNFKFADTKLSVIPYKYFGLFQFAKFAAIPLSLILVLVGGKTISTAAENSLPNDKILYTVKRATEQARLTLTTDQNKIASLHIEMTQRRLDEVKKAISSNDHEAETAAIIALRTQVDKTFSEVPSVAAVQAITDQNTTLLNTLVAINNEQKTVLSSIADNSDTNTAVSEILEKTEQNQIALAKIQETVDGQVETANAKNEADEKATAEATDSASATPGTDTENGTASKTDRQPEVKGASIATGSNKTTGSATAPLTNNHSARSSKPAPAPAPAAVESDMGGASDKDAAPSEQPRAKARFITETSEQLYVP